MPALITAGVNYQLKFSRQFRLKKMGLKNQTFTEFLHTYIIARTAFSIETNLSPNIVMRKKIAQGKLKSVLRLNQESRESELTLFSKSLINEWGEKAVRPLYKSGAKPADAGRTLCVGIPP